MAACASHTRLLQRHQQELGDVNADALHSSRSPKHNADPCDEHRGAHRRALRPGSPGKQGLRPPVRKHAFDACNALQSAGRPLCLDHVSAHMRTQRVSWRPARSSPVSEKAPSLLSSFQRHFAPSDAPEHSVLNAAAPLASAACAACPSPRRCVARREAVAVVVLAPDLGGATARGFPRRARTPAAAQYSAFSSAPEKQRVASQCRGCGACELPLEALSMLHSCVPIRLGRRRH
jgi:hypothetical protein